MSCLGRHVFPAREDGGDPRLCPSCGKGQLSLKLGKFGAFIGCSNYPECRFTRVLSPNGQENGAGEGGDRPGVKVLGVDDRTGDEITLRNGRFGEYVQQGEGEKPKRSSLPKGMKPEDVTLEKAMALLSLPREVAKHPTSGDPIVAGIGRYGSYVQHGKTYANLGRDDDVLEIGANRAIDLIVAKESGAGSRFGSGSGRELGEHPTMGGKVTVRSGRFGPYVSHNKVNATLPKGTSPESRDARGGGRSARGQGKRSASPARVRSGPTRKAARSPCAPAGSALMSIGARSTPISRSRSTPEMITLSDAMELLAERGGKPAAKPAARAKAEAAKRSQSRLRRRLLAKESAKKAPAKKAAAKKKKLASDAPHALDGARHFVNTDWT